MGLKHYPRTYTLYDEVSKKVSKGKSLWMDDRGFIPNESLVYENNLVIPLYTEENEFLAFQLRDIYETDINTKYKLSNQVFHPIVKTDREDIKTLKVLCEGTIDCCLLRTKGINAYTTLGLQKQRLYRAKEELEEHKDKLFLIFDNDYSGKVSAKIFESICLRLFIPLEYKDICEFYKQDRERFDEWIVSLKELTCQVQ